MSPWPLLMGGSVLGGVVSMVKIFAFMEFNSLLLAMFMVIIVFMCWERDVVRESTFQGYHSSVVMQGLIYGMILFIISEIFFFLSFFWAFFHSSLSPAVELGCFWPPLGISSLSAFQVPLLNTVVLLSSGVTITWAHQAIVNEDWFSARWSLCLTWVLGVYFLTLQKFEYTMASFSMTDSVFGSVFYMATGFHGFHVMVGTIFLIVMFIRLMKSHFSMSHHFGFESAAWYWHFVDVVWLFLFCVVYWWGA